jgi:hypothetical protein
VRTPGSNICNKGENPPKSSFRNEGRGKEWWLTPVIPATGEAEIKRIMVQDYSGQKVSKIPS